MILVQLILIPMIIFNPAIETKQIGDTCNEDGEAGRVLFMLDCNSYLGQLRVIHPIRLHRYIRRKSISYNGSLSLVCCVATSPSSDKPDDKLSHQGKTNKHESSSEETTSIVNAFSSTTSAKTGYYEYTGKKTLTSSEKMRSVATSTLPAFTDMMSSTTTPTGTMFLDTKYKKTDNMAGTNTTIVNLSTTPGPATSKFSTSTANSSHFDITSHPNLRLLPKNCGTYSLFPRVMYGKRVHVGEFPWAVVLYYLEKGMKKLHCGGSLITDRFVLTAAHCLRGGPGLRAALGEVDLLSQPDCEHRYTYTYCAPNSTELSVEKLIPHEAYDIHSKINDIGLAKLERPVDFKVTIRPVCLPYTRELVAHQLNSKDIFHAVGWGFTGSRSSTYSTILLKTSLMVIKNEECNKYYKKYKLNATESQVCMVGLGRRDTCNGDSGGPLTATRIGTVRPLGRRPRAVQYAVVSYGPKPCGGGRLPSVNTRLDHYMHWILDNLNE